MKLLVWALLVGCVAAMDAGVDESASVDAGVDESASVDAGMDESAIRAYNKEHSRSFWTHRITQVLKACPNTKKGTLNRIKWDKTGNMQISTPAKSAMWARYARRENVWLDNEEDPPSDLTFPLSADPEEFEVGRSRHHVCPNAVIDGFWTRLMSLANEQRGEVNGLFDETGFLARMSTKFPDLKKFVEYTQDHCRLPTTKCDAMLLGTFNYTDEHGHAFTGASEALRFVDSLVYWPGNLFPGPKGDTRADDPESWFETKACHTLDGGQVQYEALKGMCEKMRRVTTIPAYSWSPENVATTSEACTSLADVVGTYTTISKINATYYEKVKTCHRVDSRNCQIQNKKMTRCSSSAPIERKGTDNSCRWVIKGAMCPGTVKEQLAPCHQGDVNPDECLAGGTNSNPFMTADMTHVVARLEGHTSGGLRGGGDDDLLPRKLLSQKNGGNNPRRKKKKKKKKKRGR